MKIGVLIDRITVGGVEKIALEQVAALQRAGHEVTLLVMSRKYEAPKAYDELLKHITVVHLEDRLPGWQRTSFKMPLFAFFSLFHVTYPWFLPKVVKSSEFDYIISHNPYTTFTARALARRRNIPYAYYVHDYISYIMRNGYSAPHKKAIFSLLVPLAEYIDKKLLADATAVLVQGQDHFDQLSHMMRDPQKLHFIAPGHEVLEHIPLKRGHYFLILTAWKEGKKIEGLLSALRPEDGFKLKLAGKWIHAGYRAKIEALIRERGLQDMVQIVGEVSESEVNKLFRGARAGIIYSNEKGFGMTSIEAAANGCTFIIPKNCGAARCFRDGVDGFFYDFGNDNTLRQHMLTLATDDDLAYLMGESAWQFVKHEYSWAKHIQTIASAMQAQTALAAATALPAEDGVTTPTHSVEEDS